MDEFNKLKNELFLNIADGLAKIERYLEEREKALKDDEVSNCIKTFTTSEAAEILHVSRQTLSLLAKTGKIRATKLGQGWIFRETELKNFLEREEMKRDSYVG